MEPEDIRKKEFLVSLRGYDRDEVDQFLGEIAEELRSLKGSRPPAEPSPDADRQAMYRQVGEETSKILLAAEAAGKDIRERAQQEAAGLLTDSRAQAQDMARQAAAERQSAEEDLRRLREARAMLASQLQDTGRRIEEIVSRLSAPLEAPPAAKRARAKRPETAASAAGAGAPAEAEGAILPESLSVKETPLIEKTVSPAMRAAPVETSVAPAKGTAAAEAVYLPRPQAPAPDFEVPPAVAPKPVAASVESVAVLEASAPAPPSAPAAEVTDAPVDSPTARLQGLLEEARREREQARLDIEEAISRATQTGQSAPAAPSGLQETKFPPSSFQEIKPSPSSFQEIKPPLRPASSMQAPAPVETAPSQPTTPGGAQISSRDATLGDIPAAAARRLKRLLQEDENFVLDRIRSVRNAKSFDDDISSTDDHIHRFRQGLGDSLEEAFAAGRRFADATGPGAASATVNDLITKQIVNPLRKEVGRVVEAGLAAQDTLSSVSGRASDVFRVWKGVRTELLGEGLAYSAFHHGMLDAWRERRVSTKRWVASSDEGECPKGVCAANAAAEAVPIDDPFPSGHLAPPAHGGCNCSLGS